MGDKRGNQSGKNMMVEPHWHEGVFICHGKEDALVTKIWSLENLCLERRDEACANVLSQTGSTHWSFQGFGSLRKSIGHWDLSFIHAQQTW